MKKHVYNLLLINNIPTLIDLNHYPMMKYTLSVTALLFLFVLTARGQDTTKTDNRSRKKALFLRSLKTTFKHLSPPQFEHERITEDSIRRSMLPPEHHHPTLYIDGGFGYVAAGLRGVQANYSLNYQKGLSLFTFRGLANGSSRTDPSSVFRIFSYEKTGTLSELALMYGLRFNSNQGHAYSFSAGIDHNDRSAYYYDSANNRTQIEGEYIGVPFEANYQWYTHRFGVSFGIKLSGNISRHDFIGIGVDMGLGYHSSH